jgi:hypothetical protein
MAQATLRYNPEHTQAQVIIEDSDTFFDPVDAAPGLIGMFEDDDGSFYMATIGPHSELEADTVYQITPLETKSEVGDFESDEDDEESDDEDSDDDDEDEDDEEEDA